MDRQRNVGLRRQAVRVRFKWSLHQFLTSVPLLFVSLCYLCLLQLESFLAKLLPAGNPRCQLLLVLPEVRPAPAAAAEAAEAAGAVSLPEAS